MAAAAATEQAATEVRRGLAISGVSVKRALIADDNLVNAQVAEFHLAARGYAVTTVGNGAAAVEAVGTQRFDVVLLDLQMPVMDGVPAARMIRSLEAERVRPTTPLVAYSAALQADDEDIRTLFDGVLPKPFSASALSAVLHSLEASRPAATGRPRAPLRDDAATAAIQRGIGAASASHAQLDPKTFGAFVEEFGLDGVVPLLATLRSTIAQAQVELGAIIAAKDGTRLARLAHKTKGAAGLVGALPLAAVARTLEASAKLGFDAGGETAMSFSAALSSLGDVLDRLQTEDDVSRLLLQHARAPAAAPSLTSYSECLP